MSNFGIFYDARSPNMAVSCDPRSKFRKTFNFFLIMHLILGKVTKFLVGKLSTSEVISQKPHGGVENTPSPSAFRVKKHICGASTLYIHFHALFFTIDTIFVMAGYKNQLIKKCLRSF